MYIWASLFFEFVFVFYRWWWNRFSGLRWGCDCKAKEWYDWLVFTIFNFVSLHFIDGEEAGLEDTVMDVAPPVNDYPSTVVETKEDNKLPIEGEEIVIWCMSDTVCK